MVEDDEEIRGVQDPSKRLPDELEECLQAIRAGGGLHDLKQRGVIRLGASAIGDVFAKACNADHGALRIPQDGVVPGYESTAAEGRENFVFVVGEEGALLNGVPVDMVEAQFRRNKALKPVLPNDLVPFAAEQPEQILVAESDPAGGVQKNGYELGVFEQFPELAFAFTPCVLGAPSVDGDGRLVGEEADQLNLLVGKRAGTRWSRRR